MNTTDSRIARLTLEQCACLRLVKEHFSSKQIGQRLGISASAVDKRIERAVAVLGAETRFDAARKLAQAEQAHDHMSSDVPDLLTGIKACELEPAATMPDLNTDRMAIAVRVPWTPLKRLSLIGSLIFALSVSLLVALTIAERIVKLWNGHVS